MRNQGKCLELEERNHTRDIVRSMQERKTTQDLADDNIKAWSEVTLDSGRHESVESPHSLCGQTIEVRTAQDNAKLRNLGSTFQELQSMVSQTAEL